MSNSDHQTRTTLEAGPRLRSGRAPHVVLGILAGLTLWALDEVSGAGEVGRIAAALTILAWIGFSASGVLLAYLGPARAVRTGAILGGLVGALAWVSMGGFATPQGFFNAGHPTTALLVLAILPLPFLTCFYRGTGISYRHLYIESWDILVRSAAAWAFAGLVLAVAFASAELLRLVGVELLHDLLREDMVIAILLGGTVGLGLAVVAELNDMISPDLALRLVRLLTPFVLLVLAVFLAMVPVRGLTALFGSVSTGGSLIAAGLGAIGLVSVVVGKDDLDGPAHGILYLSARIMAALVICLGGLAVASVWMRVSQYGWTPERVSAAAMSAIVVSYGGAYLLALLRGAAWRRGIRAGNVAVALGVIGLGVMWLNPWLTPERVAVVSQLARLDPASDVERLPLWEMAHEWGRAGESALEALRKDASPALADRLAVLDRSGSRYAFDQSGFDTPEGRKALLNIVPVLPEGRSLDDATLESLLGAVGRQASALRNFEAVCARQTKAGHPQCLIVLADVDGRAEGEEMLILSADATPMVLARAVDGAGERRQSFWEQPSGMSVSDMIDAFWRDGVRLVPAQTYNFELDGALLRPRS